MILEGQNNWENVGIEIQEMFDCFYDIFKEDFGRHGVARLKCAASKFLNS